MKHFSSSLGTHSVLSTTGFWIESIGPWFQSRSWFSHLSDRTISLVIVTFVAKLITRPDLRHRFHHMWNAKPQWWLKSKDQYNNGERKTNFYLWRLLIQSTKMMARSAFLSRIPSSCHKVKKRKMGSKNLFMQSIPTLVKVFSVLLRSLDIHY